MTAIVPETRIGKIEFYEGHVAGWAAHASALGLTGVSVAALAALTAEARAAFTAHVAAQAAARAATQDFYNKVRAMHAGAGAGADMIQTIKTSAEIKDDPNIYVLAQIPAPRSTHSTVPPPGTPHGFIVKLLGDGSVRLSWKCDNHGGGTVYEIKRRLDRGGGPQRSDEYVGASGSKSFVDDSIPAGTGSAVYLITAVRSTSRGQTGSFVLNFGVSGMRLAIAQSTLAA